jgi:hypothetical protein
VKRLLLLAVLVQLAAVAMAGASRVVDARGLGDTKFGMTVSQFSRAVGEALSEPQEPDEQGCFYLEAKRYPGVAFMFEDHRLRRIDVHSSRVTTSDGVTVGTSVTQIKRRYGRRLLDEPHHYSGPEDRYLTLSLGSTFAVRFETSGDRVDNYYLGYKAQVQYVEGCL